MGIGLGCLSVRLSVIYYCKLHNSGTEWRSMLIPVDFISAIPQWISLAFGYRKTTLWCYAVIKKKPIFKMIFLRDFTDDISAITQ